MLMIERQKINSGLFLFETEQKAKKAKNEKRQAKQKQELYNEEILSVSSGGNTTVTDEEAV